MSETYNGWTNYETWVVKLWMDNEEASQRFFAEIAEEIWGDAEADVLLTRSETARCALAGRLKDEHGEGRPFIVGVWGDLIGAALSEVNWSEIANALLENHYDGYEPIDYGSDRRAFRRPTRPARRPGGLFFLDTARQRGIVAGLQREVRNELPKL